MRIMSTIFVITSFLGLGIVFNWMALRAMGITETSGSMASSYTTIGVLITGFVFLAVSIIIAAIPLIWNRYFQPQNDDTHSKRTASTSKEHLRVVK